MLPSARSVGERISFRENEAANTARESVLNIFINPLLYTRRSLSANTSAELKPPLARLRPACRVAPSNEILEVNPRVGFSILIKHVSLTMSRQTPPVVYSRSSFLLHCQSSTLFSFAPALRRFVPANLRFETYYFSFYPLLYFLSLPALPSLPPPSLPSSIFFPPSLSACIPPPPSQQLTHRQSSTISHHSDPTGKRPALSAPAP